MATRMEAGKYRACSKAGNLVRVKESGGPPPSGWRGGPEPGPANSGW